MNKSFYRVIFSKSLGQIIVVSEATKSCKKSPSNSARINLIATLLAGSIIGTQACAEQSQILASSTVSANQRATLLQAPNGTALINIQTPNGKGVSRNVYSKFDILDGGAILNNSRSGANSQLAGAAIGANPWLGAGEAKVIVNEVQSSLPSRFEGNLEVAGARADVIIASPAGINIKGGGFINANKTVFTTGAVNYNSDGSIKSFFS